MHESSLPPLLPDGRSRRLSASWPMRKLRAMIAPFKPLRGGPLLDDCTHQHVDCGMVNVDFFEPRAYLGEGNSPATVDLSNDDTFNQVANNRRAKHTFVELGCSNWSYYSPIWDINRFLPVPHEPYVIITAIWQIERVKRGVLLEVGDMAGLERYLREDYDLFLESEGGRNWEIRRDLKKQFEGYEDMDSEDSKPIIDHYLECLLISPPAAYEALVFNGLPWLRYIWDEQQSLPEAINYSRTLSNQTILTVYFGITQMTPGGFTRWWKPLLRDSEALMSGVTITQKCLSAPSP